MAQLAVLAEHYAAARERLDYRAALVCAVLANCFRDRKKRAKAFQPSDFMPRQKQQEQTPEQMKFALMVAARAREMKHAGPK